MSEDTIKQLIKRIEELEKRVDELEDVVADIPSDIKFP